LECAACVLASEIQSANITHMMLWRAFSLLSLRTRLQIGAACIVLFGAIGFPSFNVCYGNGGNIFSCAMIGVLIGGGHVFIWGHVFIFVYMCVFAVLIDGFIHLHGTF
jgi:hypothetical protein